ncbi:MAG TPA: Tim44/TimA family putative adaptor protein [Alphaproteobacteria bacterium]|nr:Tim44/TimA family putative adaptor protein [Alphaproteobacteria bacterium]
MGDGFLDIILFAVVAGFIILRLRSVLGRRPGNGQRPPDVMTRQGKAGEDNVIPLPDHSNEDEEAPGLEPATGYDDGSEKDSDEVRQGDDDEPRPVVATEATLVAAGLTEIRLVDSSFDVETFVEGARVAYEMIIAAFANGDEETLGQLLSDSVLDDFTGAIRDRQERNEILETTLVSLETADPLDARVVGDMAEVTVKFVAEISNVTRDAEGEVVAGDAMAVNVVTDIWTFARDVRSSDPNWRLIETRSMN